MNTLNLSRKLSARSCTGCYLLILAGLLATVMPLRADNPPTYLFEIDSSAVPGGFTPIFVALDSSNNVYVTDEFNDRVVKLDKNNNYLTQWGSYGTGNGQFFSAYGIAVDRSNNVYVSDLNNRVEKFDSGGNYLTQWGSFGSGNGQFSSPWGIAVDSSNNVYVADLQNNRVEKFDGNGNYLTQWGSLGSGNGQFNNPAGVAVDSSNNVYVTDTGNNRVDKFTSNGNYLAQWGSLGSGNGQFSFPTGLAVDSNNNVYVADNGKSRIEKFDSSGSYLTQWGGSGGSGNGQFYNPYGIAVDSTGNFIYVADLGNNRVQVFVYNANILPPIFTQQPTNQTVLAGIAGINVTFSASVVGTAPFAYQWMSNNVALPNETNSTFTLINVTLSDAATYAVLVTNSLGSALSSNAVLTVLPALVTTLPASEISATGAVLNASVTLGADETLAWIQWGTDTNYGNIAGVTNIPGGAGTVIFTNTLIGLDGNLIYHYQVVASNSFGIVYGSDQSFQVGLRPTIVSIFATSVTTTSATLNAIVNPQGRETTVYFHWGITAITNSSPGIDIGAAATSLNVSSFITNLIIGTVYHVSVLASNSAGTFFNGAYTFQALPWNFTTAPTMNWQSIASSADGNKLAAVPYGGPIVTSTNAGITWRVSGPSGALISVASSANGDKLVAAIGGFFSFQSPGPIYTSTNSGQLMTKSSAPLWHWDCVASSADGNRLAAVANGGAICTSPDSGVTWTSNNVPATSSSNSLCIASSADGSRLVVAVDGGLIYTSTNAGSTWITNNVPATNWQSIATSADGSKLAAAVGGYSPNVSAGIPGPIYTSTNAGATWMPQTNAPIKDWFCVASSADGNKLVAVAFGAASGYTNSIYISTDAGVTWTVSEAPATAWEWVASSADGNKLAAVANSNFSGTGKIYTQQTTPAPALDLSASDNGTAISWIIPSLDFTLQQNLDLSNWTVVTNVPVLNLTNLQNQVTLPPPAGNNFFRLMH